MATIVAAGVCVYANSFEGVFVLDDHASITANRSIRDLGSFWQILHPRAGITVSGRTLINLSVALNYALGGTEVWGYHLLNLLVHLLAGLTLFGIVRRSLLLPALKERFAGASTGLALVVALIWTVHPLQTDSVTYIIQRAESIMGLFYLLTLYCVVRGATGSRRSRWYIAAVMSCALGMTSKETMVTAPLMVLLYDRIYLATSWREMLRRRWPLYAGLVVTWVLLAALILSTGFRADAIEKTRTTQPLQYALTQFEYIVLYLRLVIWPDGLAIDYGTALVDSAAGVIPFAAVVVALVAATGVSLHRWPAVGYWGAWFFIILSPTSSVVALNQVAHEHRLYLPLAGVLMLLALAGFTIVRRLKLPRSATVAAVAAVIAALGYLTIDRNRDYHSVEAIWQANISHRPSVPQSYTRLAGHLADRGELNRALSVINRGLAVDNGNAKAYQRRGEIYLKMGQHHKAIADQDRAIALLPTFQMAYLSRGNAYLVSGRHRKAIEDYTHLLQAGAKLPKLYANRGFAFQEVGRLDRAIEDFSQAVKQAPDVADPYFQRGNAYVAAGRYSSAVEDFTRAIQLSPRDPRFTYNRGNARYHLKQYKDAIEDFTRAVELDASKMDAYHNRAACYFHTGQYDKAWADIKRLKDAGQSPNAELVRQLILRTGAGTTRADPPADR